MGMGAGHLWEETLGAREIFRCFLFSVMIGLDMKFWEFQKTFQLFAVWGVFSIWMVVKSTETLEHIKREATDSAVRNLHSNSRAEALELERNRERAGREYAEGGVSVCEGCHSRVPQTGALKPLKFICSQFWRLKVTAWREFHEGSLPAPRCLLCLQAFL